MPRGMGAISAMPIHVEGMRQLLGFLTEDCCQGQPELCGSTIKKAKTVCANKGG